MQTIFDPRHASIIGNLRSARRAADVSLEELAARLARADRSQLSLSALSRIERGERRLDVIELYDLCTALGLPWRHVLPPELRDAS